LFIFIKLKLIMLNRNIFYAFKRILLFILISLSFLNIVEANSTIPSLLKSLEKMEVSSIYVDSLTELAFLYTRNDLSKAEKYTDKAYELSQKLKYLLGLSNCENIKGIIAEKRGDFSKAIVFYNNSLTIRTTLENKSKIASSYNNIGLCYFYQNKITEALKNYQLGLNTLAGEPIEGLKGHLYNSISDSYSLEGDHKNTVIYLDSSFQVWNQLNDNSGKARILNSKGIFYFDLQNWKAAKKNFEESLNLYQGIQNNQGIAVCYIGLGNIYLELKEIEQAFDYYKKALELKDVLNLQDLANLYHNLGVHYKEKREFRKALQFYKQSEEIFIDLEDEWGLAAITLEIGNIYKKQSNYTIARDYYLKGLEFSKKDSDPYNKATLTSNLSEVYLKLGKKDLAIKYNQLHNDIRDSIFYNKMDAVNHQSNLDEEQKKTAQLTAKNAKLELEVSENKRAKLINNVILGALGFVSFFGFLFYRNQQKRQVAEYEKEQAYLEIDELLINKELEIAYAQLDAKDATQKQIGQDLHDRLGMMLSTIKLYFTEFSQELKSIKKEPSKNEHKTFELLDEAVEEVRRIAQDMQSGVLQKFGLASAVKDLAETIKHSNQLTVEVNAHGIKDRIPNQLEVKIYKIIQELIGNVLKHAKAKKLTIYLHRQDGLFNLIVEDDGIGFQPDKIADKGGMGLKNITFRVTELNGTCHFDSNENKGTSVIIDIPIENT